MPSLPNPLFCALDLPDLCAALALGRSLGSGVGGLKVGLELFAAHGGKAVRAVADLGLPVFLDLKLHDIPNTVGGAVRALNALPIAYLTVHAGGGRAMLQAAAAEAGDGRTVLAVTVLTSLDDADLRAAGVAGGVSDQVLRLADTALGAGVGGLVCSPREVAPLRERFGRAPLLVVPGIRPASRGDDQKRTMTPTEALAAGADVLVVGRPITGAPDPALAARHLLAGARSG